MKSWEAIVELNELRVKVGLEMDGIREIGEFADGFTPGDKQTERQRCLKREFEAKCRIWHALDAAMTALTIDVQRERRA